MSPFAIPAASVCRAGVKALYESVKQWRLLKADGAGLMEQYRKQRISQGLSVTCTAEKGFTLVEVLIAMVVLSIGFFGAASMHISAIDANTSANRMMEATHLAQSRLETLMSLEYTQDFTDPDLISDNETSGTAEPFNDFNSNGLWDFGESYADSNHNRVWDAAHMDPSPPPGYVITWSVIDNRPVPFAKYIRMYVTGHRKKSTLLFTCIKSRQ